MAFDMPGAPVCWVSDTYSNLTKNVLPSVLEGLQRKGWVEGVHFVVGKIPPSFTEAEKEDLPRDIREHFWKPFNPIVSYKHTIVFFTGFNITFGSLDRPASLAGRSYVHVFGDEVKYFPERKIANLLKAVRGYKVKYGNSVYYRGRTFTTDMPNTAHIGEHDWILRMGAKMDPEAIALVAQVSFALNEALQEYLVAEESGNREEAVKKRRTYERWYERWQLVRLRKEAHLLFFIASSYINVDILTLEWFEDAINDDLGDVKTAVLSIRAMIESGDRFYSNLGEQHFYDDGTDEVWENAFGLRDEEDCRILKYHNKDLPIDGGMDFGNMMSLTLAQQDKKYYRCLKFMYTLSPEWIPDLAKQFLAYYKPHRRKVLNLYYDRAGNNLQKAKQDYASQMKKSIEQDENGVKTGWTVVLMSQNQGNIGKNEEYNFMNVLLGGYNKLLPKVIIDRYHCKPLKCSLELAPAKKDSSGKMVKDKRSENLQVKRLVYESTNASDSFKYLMMRKNWRKLAFVTTSQSAGDVSTKG
jgi:hypothetical protein